MLDILKHFFMIKVAKILVDRKVAAATIQKYKEIL